MDHGESSYRRFLEGDKNAFEAITSATKKEDLKGDKAFSVEIKVVD